jgi:hypothetical protein
MAQITSRPIQTESGTSTAARRISGRTIAKYIVLAVSGIFLFKSASDYAYIQRGYKAIGGEFFLLFLPLWYWLISRTIGDFFDMFKDSGSKIQNTNSGGKNDD